MTSRALLWLMVVGAWTVGACERRPGGSCQPREAHCLDASTALLCSDGKLTAVPCRGESGCRSRDGKTSCDVSGNQPGDHCRLEDQGVAACASPREMLACREATFAVVPCGGPRGCEMVGEQARCDQSVADPEQACHSLGATACSTDESRVLTCRDGRMTELYRCRGEGKCRASGGKLACDQTVAKVGDRCDKALSGHIACSEDKEALITCRDERFVAYERCKAGTACTVHGQSTKCERR